MHFTSSETLTIYNRVNPPSNLLPHSSHPRPHSSSVALSLCTPLPLHPRQTDRFSSPKSNPIKRISRISLLHLHSSLGPSASQKTSLVQQRQRQQQRQNQNLLLRGFAIQFGKTGVCVCVSVLRKSPCVCVCAYTSHMWTVATGATRNSVKEGKISRVVSPMAAFPMVNSQQQQNIQQKGRSHLHILCACDCGDCGLPSRLNPKFNQPRSEFTGFANPELSLSRPA